MCHSELPTARRLLSVADVQVANFCFPARPAPSRHGPLGVGARGRASVSWSVLVWVSCYLQPMAGRHVSRTQGHVACQPNREVTAGSQHVNSWLGSPKGRLTAGRRASQLEAHSEPKPWGLRVQEPYTRPEHSGACCAQSKRRSFVLVVTEYPSLGISEV